MGWDGMGMGWLVVLVGEGLIFEVDFRRSKGSKAIVEFGRGFLLR